MSKDSLLASRRACLLIGLMVVAAFIVASAPAMGQVNIWDSNLQSHWTRSGDLLYHHGDPCESAGYFYQYNHTSPNYGQAYTSTSRFNTAGYNDVSVRLAGYGGSNPKTLAISGWINGSWTALGNITPPSSCGWRSVTPSGGPITGLKIEWPATSPAKFALLGHVTVRGTVPPPTNATASPATICRGGSSTLSVSVENFSAEHHEVKWYKKVGDSYSEYVGSGLEIAVSPTSTTDYRAWTHHTTNNHWSAGSNVVTVTALDVDQPPAPTAENNGPVCEGGTLSLTASTISGATYSWTGPNNFTSSEQNPTVSTNATAAMSGTYSVTATVSGCASPAGTTNVTVAKPPTTASVGGPQAIGEGETTAALGGNEPTVGTGQWSIVSGGTGTFNPDAATPNGTFTHATGEGPVVLRWTISNPPCTASYADVEITIASVSLSVRDVKKQPNNEAVVLSGKIVTAVFSDHNHFYVTEPNRSSGIRVVPQTWTTGLVLGDVVDVEGTIKTTDEGERYIDADSVIIDNQ